jgi:hypothetical protein
MLKIKIKINFKNVSRHHVDDTHKDNLNPIQLLNK